MAEEEYMKDRRKILRKYGNSLVIVLNREEQEGFDFKEGDFVDITIKPVMEGED